MPGYRDEDGHAAGRRGCEGNDEQGRFGRSRPGVITKYEDPEEPSSARYDSEEHAVSDNECGDSRKRHSQQVAHG